jgi:hypothetical protein
MKTIRGAAQHIFPVACRIVYWGFAVGITVWLVQRNVYPLRLALSFLRASFAEAQVTFAQGSSPQGTDVSLYRIGMASLAAFIAWMVYIVWDGRVPFLRKMNGGATALLLTHTHFLFLLVIAPPIPDRLLFFLTCILVYGIYFGYIPTRFFGHWTSLIRLPLIVLWPNFVIGLAYREFSGADLARQIKDAWITLGASFVGAIIALARSAWQAGKQTQQVNETDEG